MKYFLMVLAIFLGACTSPPTIHKIALIAPFEGQYGAIGYNALYAARMALNDSPSQVTELLFIDDGGTVQTALQRLQALHQDESVRYILLITPHLSPHVDSTIPTIAIADWYDDPTHSQTIIADGAWLLNEARGADTTAQTLRTDAAPMTEAFIRAYLQSGDYTPQPNILAPLIYDATRMLLDAIHTPMTYPYEGRYHQLNLQDGRLQSDQRRYQPLTLASD